MDFLKYAVLIVLAVAVIFLAIAAGAGLLNRTPLRHPPRIPPSDDDRSPAPRGSVRSPHRDGEAGARPSEGRAGIGRRRTGRDWRRSAAPAETVIACTYEHFGTSLRTGMSRRRARSDVAAHPCFVFLRCRTDTADGRS